MTDEMHIRVCSAPVNAGGFEEVSPSSAVSCNVEHSRTWHHAYWALILRWQTDLA